MRRRGRRLPSLRRPAERRNEGSVVGPDTGTATSASLPAAADDLARRAILEPLLDALEPSSVLVCWIDQTPAADPALPIRRDAVVTSCRPEGLARAAERAPEVIWIRGQPNWHTLHALGA